jgi:hypothetical protein
MTQDINILVTSSNFTFLVLFSFHILWQKINKYVQEKGKIKASKIICSLRAFNLGFITKEKRRKIIFKYCTINLNFYN